MPSTFIKYTALSDLLGVSTDKINDDRLYRALGQLLPHKQTLEIHLKRRMGQLFGLEYDILLYDITSTYFEGQAHGNSLEHYGGIEKAVSGFRRRKISLPEHHDRHWIHGFLGG